MTTEITVAVTELVQFCHRRGDIDHRFSPSPTGEQGVAGHQWIYARRPPTYQSEYAVQHQYSAPGLLLHLRGRADGYDAQRGLVEEIKTCRVTPATIPEAVSQMHMAQARMYAAIIALQQGLSTLQVHLTWLNVDTREEFTVSETLSSEELSAFLAQTLNRFASWLHTVVRLRRDRDASLSALDFPYGDFRRGQRQLAELGYQCIDQGGHLQLEAPTGIGKTAALLFAALKALATGKHDRIVFVTARTVGRHAAQDTLAYFREAGYRGTALSLTARDTLCLSPGSACHANDCRYASAYYDKLPEAMDAAISSPALTRETITALARQFELCPYQLSLDLLPWVDVVIADQHYVYSPTATLGGHDERRWTVLLDEAHNLPHRARAMYSARLAKSQLMAAKSGQRGQVARSLTRINRCLLAMQKEKWQEPRFDSRDQLPDRLLGELHGFASAVVEQLLPEPAFLQSRPVLRDFFYQVLQFLRVALLWGEDYRFEMSRDDGKQSLCLDLNCLDPSRLLSLRQDSAHAVLAFSATLSPLPWSRDRLGLGQHTVCHTAASPFGEDQLQVSVATHIDTRYRQRDASLPALADLLLAWLRDVPGNCIVYFPSYQYLQNCFNCMQQTPAADIGRHYWLQQRGQDEAGRDELFTALHKRRDVAALCILGGVFGEGIDLPGEQLASVVVVGVGMPQVNRETRLLQAWYQQRTGAGFEYVFLYPGMQKVDQALGRVVRTLDDYGRALLVDPRYALASYRQLLPPGWRYSHVSADERNSTPSPRREDTAIARSAAPVATPVDFEDAG